jgi:hypothetical protein
MEHSKEDLLIFFQALQNSGLSFCVNDDFTEIIERLISISITDRYTSITPDPNMIALS